MLYKSCFFYVVVKIVDRIDDIYPFTYMQSDATEYLSIIALNTKGKYLG